MQNSTFDYLYTNIASNAQQLEQLVFETVSVRRIRRLGRHCSWRNRVEEGCNIPEDETPLVGRDFHKALHNAYEMLERYKNFVKMAMLLEFAMWKNALASDIPISLAEHRPRCCVISGARHCGGRCHVISKDTIICDVGACKHDQCSTVCILVANANLQ